MSREEWLEHRRHSIGGSDASAIIGLNPWSSPFYVWAEKIGKIPPKEDNEAMRLGRDLEDYVAKRFTEKTGKKVRRENNILVNHIYPFAHANVDRMIVGEDAGLECKTTSVLNLKKFKGGEYPETYYVQCVHYMAVTGCKRWYLAVLVLGEGFYDFTIERDEDEIKALMESEREFWEFVERKTPPPTDGLKATTEALSIIYPQDNGGAVNLMAYELDLTQYMNLTKSIKHLENCRDEAANKIKAFLGESAKGETDRFKVSWTSASKSTFDHKRFAKEHPEIDLSGYYKTSAYRTFKVSENSK
jgi:putative phage-type endonuclease